MKITTFVSLAGSPDTDCGMYQAYSKIILEVESIFVYLEKIEAWFLDDTWHIISIKNIQFDVESEGLTEDDLYIYRYSLN